MDFVNKKSPLKSKMSFVAESEFVKTGSIQRIHVFRRRTVKMGTVLSGPSIVKNRKELKQPRILRLQGVYKSQCDQGKVHI